MLRSALRMVVLASCVVASGCSGAPSDRARPTEPLTWEAFTRSIRSLPDGSYVVDGDIRVVGDRDLHAYFEAAKAEVDRELSGESVGTVSEPLLLFTVDGVDSKWAPADKLTLTYCVSSAFGSNTATVISTLDAAGRSWSDRVAVRFQYVETATCDNTTNVQFDVVPFVSATFNAASFFPYYPRSKRELFLSPSAFTDTAGGRDFVGILRHELGHALGFRHEHIVLDPPCSAPPNPPEPIDDPATSTIEGYRALTEYDVGSVMHYPECRPGGQDQTGYHVSEIDYKGAIGLYGLAAALVMSVRIN